MATYHQYAPSGLLSNFIECYWTFDACSTGVSVTEPLIPGGRVELIFNLAKPLHFLQAEGMLKGHAMTHVSVMGQRGRVYYVKQNSYGDTRLLGVRFKPGGIAAFTRIPVDLLLNQVIPAEEVLGKHVNGWLSQLSEEETDTDGVSLLDQLMSPLIKDSPGNWAACNKAVNIIRAGNSTSVRALCDDSASYYKKLERIFLHCVGYTPKHYSRIVRFNKAIRQMKSSVDSLTTISHACDYYDQSHFIKDFRQFTGTTPGHFQRERHAMADFLINHQTV